MKVNSIILVYRRSEIQESLECSTVDVAGAAAAAAAAAAAIITGLT